MYKKMGEMNWQQTLFLMYIVNNKPKSVIYAMRYSVVFLGKSRCLGVFLNSLGIKMYFLVILNVGYIFESLSIWSVF